MLTDLSLKYLVSRDQTRQAQTIERLSYPDTFDWPVLDGAKQLGLTAKCIECGSGLVVGYVIVRNTPARSEILRLAVDPEWRRQGIGSRLVGDVLDRAATACREIVVATVPETDLGSLQMFKGCGFGRSWLVRQPSGPDFIGMGYVLREIGKPVVSMGRAKV